MLGLVHVERPLTDLLDPQALDVATGGLAPLGIAGLVLAVTQGIFSYNGYGGAVYFAEETKNAKRAIARAVLWSAIITVVAELVPLTAVLLGADSLEELFGAALPVESFLAERAGDTVTVVGAHRHRPGDHQRHHRDRPAVGPAALRGGPRRGHARSASPRRSPGSRTSTRMPVVATIVMGVLALAACFIPFDVLLNATGSTLAFSYGFIALAALVVRRTSARRRPARTGCRSGRRRRCSRSSRSSTIFVIGILDPAQWLSLGIAFGIVAAGLPRTTRCTCVARPGTLHLIDPTTTTTDGSTA